jgi:hypothetical protein
VNAIAETLVLPQLFENRSMGIELGHISAIFRYPVKSMAGQRLESARIGWHGLEAIGAWRSGVSPIAARSPG